jgi:uridine kinase
MAKVEYVIKRSGAIVPFNQDRITNAIYRAAVSVGGRDQETAEKLSGQVVELLEKNNVPGGVPSVEEVQDAVEKVLIENRHAKVAKAYILYRDARSHRRRERIDSSSRPSENIPWAKIWHVLDWAVDRGIHTIAGLNARIASGELMDVIAESENAYHEDIKNAADLILSRREELRMVFISGPSSSGKTTTTIKVGQLLEEKGIKLVALNVDNYFFDLEMHPKDEFGDYDFETPQALDLELINQHMVRLIEGEEILIPFYDFKTGHRYEDRTPMKLQKDELLLIDSLHGLYPGLSKDIPDEQKFKLYLEPLLQMKDSSGSYVRWTDIRLMRRMLRDAAYRAYDPTQTLLHWHYVRSSEMMHIIPRIGSCDYIINSAMPYELSVYSPKLIDNFAKWAEDYANDPLHEDAFERAVRIYPLLQEVTPMTDDKLVPKTSLIREFIGGSALKY